jgi:superfamily I DNA and/or RNA helicase
LKIKVDTVDSFQGSEAEVVCYSTVRTQGSLKFLLDRKRLNVACSRAKENLIFFGQSAYLQRWTPDKDEINLFHEIIERSCLTNLEALLEEF